MLRLRAIHCVCNVHTYSVHTVLNVDMSPYLLAVNKNKCNLELLCRMVNCMDVSVCCTRVEQQRTVALKCTNSHRPVLVYAERQKNINQIFDAQFARA